jgi:hypothetical protein
MRFVPENLFPQFRAKTRHDGDHHHEHGDANGHAKQGDHTDHRKKRALRFEIAQREEKTKRQIQWMRKGRDRAEMGLERQSPRRLDGKNIKYLPKYSLTT